MSEHTIAAYVAEHPRMAGVLFTTTLVLSQAGSAIAAHGTGYPGP